MIRLSIIIPVYNSPEGLADTLTSIINQVNVDLSELEVIVVDNNSTDNTYKIAENFKKKFRYFKLLHQPIQGSYAARNMGIQHSTGELLCFVDADVELEKLFLKKILEQFISQPFDYAGVNVQIKQTKRTLASDYDALKAFKVEEKMRKGNYSPTITVIVTKEATIAVDCFDERMESGGDVVFGKRIFNMGFKQCYLDDVVVTHPAREKFSSLFKKAKRVARGYAYHMFYYSDIFNHDEKFFRSIKFYLPHNPFDLKKSSNERGLGISFFRCIYAAFLAVPLAYVTRKEYYIELNKLQLNQD